MNQPHLVVQSYFEVRRRQHAKRSGNPTDCILANRREIAVLLALGSEKEDKAELVIAAIEKEPLIGATGDTIRTVAEALGFSSAPELMTAVLRRCETGCLHTATIGGFTLGVLRSCVEVPNFLHMKGMTEHVVNLLTQACYPWGVDVPTPPEESPIFQMSQCEPPMDVGGSASALNDAMRAFIAAEGNKQPSGNRGLRMAIARRVLENTRSPANRTKPLGWVGQKIMDPLLDGVFRQIHYDERADLVTHFFDTKIPKPGSQK